MGIDHVDRMHGRKPAAKIPSPSDPSSWTAEQLAEYQADDGSPWHHGRYLYFATPTPDPTPCRICWGLGFIPGANGRHITCEDCGYEEVEFK